MNDNERDTSEHSEFAENFLVFLSILCLKKIQATRTTKMAQVWTLRLKNSTLKSAGV